MTTNMLDMEAAAWGQPHGDKPWAVTVTPLFGQLVSDLPTLEDQIDSNPDGYPDGTPAYVEDIDGEGNPGWVVVYNHVPVPTVFDDVPSYGSWIDNYPVPDGVTVWVDDTGDGEGGGFVTSIDGEPIPTGPGSLETTCSGSTSVKYTIGAATATVVDTPDLVTASDTSDLP